MPLAGAEIPPFGFWSTSPPGGDHEARSGVKMLRFELAELVGAKPRTEGRLVEEPPIWGGHLKEPLDLLSSHRSALLLGRGVECAQALEGILGEVATLKCPIAKG